MPKYLEAAVTIFIAVGISANSIAWCQASLDSGSQRRNHALSIRSKQPEFRVGEEIAIEVTFTNTSEKPVLAAPVLPTAEVSYKLDVRDEKGDPVPETSYGRKLRAGKDDSGRETVTVFQTAPLRYLQPGESIKEQIVLNKLYDLSKPGAYTVQAQAQSDNEGKAKSNRFTITIKAGASK
ncbi:MAG: hypothetical protein IT161_24560 [Bryobacterales bacterium]|nr:hypothetical protein [Bryobacterales bacterium]